MRTMHLFAGAGGGLLADLILGHKPIVAIEWDQYACAVLRERAAEGWFPDLHVWEGDVQLFDASEYAGCVDCIHAGFPCQDISAAGKQAGLGKGTRSGLYREIIRIASDIRPQYLFLENVAAILSQGVGAVYADLASISYEFRSLCLRASDVGANHHRDRWWCLAKRLDDSDCQSCGAFRSNGMEAGTAIAPDSTSQQSAASPKISQAGNVRHTNNNGQPATEVRSGITTRGNNHAQGAQQTSEPTGSSGKYAVLAHANRVSLQGQLREDTNPQRWTQQSGGSPRSCSASDEWWEVEPRLDRVADGVAHRVERLKSIGNGQVPLQAAVAFRILKELFSE